MLEVVNDAFDLSSQITVTLAEKMRVAKTWSRVLFGVIPEEDLPETFDLAFAEHTSAFPVNAYDMKTAYEKLAEQKRQEFLEFEREEKQKNATEYCSMKVHHDAENLVEYIVDFDTREKIKLPCHGCRESAHDARMSEIKAKRKIEKETIELKTAPLDHLSARQIIDNAIQIISAERRAAKSEHEAENSFQAWNMAVRIKQRIVENDA